MNSSSKRPTSAVAVVFTLVPIIAGVMSSNLIMWTYAIPYRSLGGDERFVVTAVYAASAAGIAGAAIGTYRFIRSGRVRQVGVWLLLVSGCITGRVGHLDLNVLPVSVSFDYRLVTASLGINFVGVVLLLVYSGAVIYPGPERWWVSS